MPRKILWLLLLLILPVLIPPLPTLAQEPDLNFADYELPLTDYTLPNGLRVILAEDHSAPVVAVDIWYHVGGANDPAGRSGFAHMFEHMMFEGSANIANGEWDPLLESIGANHNAYTANDKTAYWEVAPANQLPRILWMESDRMASLAVTEKAWETQRDVVIEEFNQRVANRPYGAANRRLFTQPMQGYVPYERSVIGSVEDLNAAKLPELQAFHDTYYKPNNATLVIVGDIDPELTQTLVQAYFGDIPAGEALVPITEQYPLPAEFPTLRTDDATGCAIGTEETLIDPQVEVPRWAATVVGPPRGTPDFYALSLLTDILAGGSSSRFEQNIIRQGKAASAYVGLSDYLGASIIYAIAQPNSGDALETMPELVRAEFDSVITNGVTEAELARVKKQTLVGSITSFRESALNTAEWLQDAVLTFDDPATITDELAQYEAVTAADIQRVAQTYLCDQPMNIQLTLKEGEEVLSDYPGLLVEPVEVEPEAEPTAEAADTKITAEVLAGLPEGIINRTGVPAALPVSESNFPPFEQFTLANDLNVIFVPQTETPKLRLQLNVGGSNAAAPADKQGVADLMADLLTKGTETRSAAEIAETIETAGGSVGSSASLEWTSLSVDAPTTATTLAFDLLSDMARNSTFPEKEFDVLKTQTLTFLEQDEVNPASMANRQFGRLAYGGHPYGFITDPETVKSLTREDVAEFHQTYFKPNNALLVIVGDISAEEAKAEAERVFGDWASGDVPEFLDYPEAELGDTSLIYLVDRPTSEQATVQVGNRAIDARNPDRYALSVVNTVLGGGSSSRLYTNLREDKGYTYGVYSRFGRPNDTSTFRVVGDVSQDHAADAVQEILKELAAIRSEPMAEQELTDAKNQLIGSFALAIEQPSDFADQLATRSLTGIPIEELNDYLQAIEQVTAAEAQAAASNYIDSDQPIIVVVGDAAVVKPQLEKLGQVMVVDNEGKAIEE
ncbi:MAG: insulinase family protein [Anaerolineales bacterium]|nr:insulinase family protein [Anaerolineales bacterium]